MATGYSTFMASSDQSLLRSGRQCIYLSNPEIKVSRPGATASHLLLDFSLTVKAANLIFIFGCASAISSAKEGKSGFIYNLVNS